MAVCRGSTNSICPEFVLGKHQAEEGLLLPHMGAKGRQKCNLGKRRKFRMGVIIRATIPLHLYFGQQDAPIRRWGGVKVIELCPAVMENTMHERRAVPPTGEEEGGRRGKDQSG